MEFLDARRLTGPNVAWQKAGSILDIACDAAEADRLVPFCEARIRDMLDAVGWGDEEIRHRRVAGGLSMIFSAPIDALYAASAIGEWAWACCDAEFNAADAPDFDAAVGTIRQAIADEVNPPLIAMRQAAMDHDVGFLWDDDEVSVGHGANSLCWPFRAIPDPAKVDWTALRDVPVGVITGTNGKTTTARIARHLLQAAGRHVGLSCTDWVSVDDQIVDRDDWSGPGGARMVLRQPAVDTAILETARGGLLRRGLGVDRADAALITNISEDHLGDFGSRSLDELLEIKWVVSRAVEDGGTLVLNADDQRLVAMAEGYGGRIVWFGLDAANPVIERHVAAGGTAYVLDEESLLRIAGHERERICTVGEVPLTLGGTARHNVANALAAAALTEALGLSQAELRAGLVTMSQDGNPGRGNLYDVDGFRVLVDFAHNPAAMQALFSMASALPARRRVLCFGQAGDRTDHQIRELTESAWSMGLDLVIVSELEHYRRGRAPGEVYGIIREALLKAGARDEQIMYFEDEATSFDTALAWAGDGDLVVILDLGRVSDIGERLRARKKLGSNRN